jgi:UDPglucose 6-dehydrogenase
MQMNIAVIGTGYVGLVSGAGFSDFGHDVTCVDIDAARVAALTRGEIPIFEPGLAELVHRNVQLGRLHFTTDTAAAVANAQLVLIAVGTPSTSDGSADLSQVFEAARQIGRAMTGFTVVVTKSTVPVGTGDRVHACVKEVASHPFAIASNPEFLKEGDAVNDFLRPSRVIIGASDARAVDVLRDAYGGVMRTGDRIQVMDLRSAELTKYAANAMLATRISFMNELARLAEVVGADIEAVRRGIGSDPRIGSKFLFAGAGFGGSCFPKDLRALRHTAIAANVPLEVVDAVERANERQKKLLGERVFEFFKGQLAGKRIGIWGLAFKPETDDIRESPALTLIAQLRSWGASVSGYDPAAMPNIRAQLGSDIQLTANALDAAKDADALVLVTEWHELRQPNLVQLAKVMKGKALFDGRNVWPAEAARAAGFSYYGVGRSAFS